MGIGLRDDLQETIDFPIKYVVSCNFSLKPIHWVSLTSITHWGAKYSGQRPESLVRCGATWLRPRDGRRVSGRKVFFASLVSPSISWILIIMNSRYTHTNYMYIYEQGPPHPPPSQMVPPPLWQGRGGFLSSQAMMYVVFIVHIMHMYR